MKRILLINTPIRLNALPNVVPTGVGIMASLAETMGWQCDVLDLNVYRPELREHELKRKLGQLDCGYDVIGISGMITTLKRQKLIAAMVKSTWPDCCLVSGGGLASDFGATLFDWIPQLDVVTVGEGELLLGTILENYSGLKGRKTVIGPESVSALDTVPPVSWSKFDMETYLVNKVWGNEAGNSSWTSFEMKRSINLISSRGCPYNCNFCDRKSTGGRNYRLCSSERMMEDVREVIEKFNVDFVAFLDDNFLSDQSRLDSFLPRIKKTGVNWGCHGRLNDIKENTAARLREAGCLYIGFGGESADPDILKRMNKKNTPRQMSRAVKLCQQEGITPNCTWIMGYPGETRQSLGNTTRFIIDHDLSQKSMFVATAYPGTVFFEEVKGQIMERYGFLETYVMELDDATKVIYNERGILNYSEMSDDEFLECRGYIERGELERI